MRSSLNRLLTSVCVAALVCAVTASNTAQATTTTSTTGWVRLAHLSPNTPPVDVYLYPYGGTSPQILLKHVAYGTLSPYQSLAPGDYLVAMRAAGASAQSNPVISTQVDVTAGKAYTVAGLGAESALTLQVLNDSLTAPSGKAAVRIIAASLQNPTISVLADTDSLATDLHFPSVTSYQPVDPGPCPLHVATATASQTTQLNFAADSTYTLAVLDGSSGAPRVLDLSDASGDTVVPKGGVNTGFGGTAQQSHSSSTQPLWLWGVLAALGVGAVAFGIRRPRRN